MKIIVCLDDNKGMLFNKRRQSQDNTLREDIINSLNGSRLLMNEYSYKQFKDTQQDHITVDNNFLSTAAEDDYCFVENLKLSPYEEKISELIIYHWNRNYPADTYFDIDLSQWELITTTEFAGNSHEKITKEIYKHTR